MGPSENGDMWTRGGQSGRLLGILHAAQRKGARRIRRRHKQSRLVDFKQLITNCRKYIREGCPHKEQFHISVRRRCGSHLMGSFVIAAYGWAKSDKFVAQMLEKANVGFSTGADARKSSEITNAGFSTRSSVTNKPLHALIHIFQDNIGPSTDFSDDTFSFVQQICPLQHFFNSSMLRNNPGSHCCLSQN